MPSLLSLPPEVRLMIMEHTFAYSPRPQDRPNDKYLPFIHRRSQKQSPDNVLQSWDNQKAVLFPGILQISRQLRIEAMPYACVRQEADVEMIEKTLPWLAARNFAWIPYNQRLIVQTCVDKWPDTVRKTCLAKRKQAIRRFKAEMAARAAGKDGKSSA